MRAAKIITGSMLFLALSIQLGVRVEVTQKSYMMEQLRAQALENDILLRDLKLNYAWITNPEQLGERAATSLGLKAPEIGAVRKLEK